MRQRRLPAPTRLNPAMRMLLSLSFLLLPQLTAAATFVVTNAGDASGTSCSSTCSLRQAIGAANLTPAADTIHFAITVPPRGEILIQPASPLPVITQPLTINGYSQSGTRVNDDPVASNAILRIRIDGLNQASGSLLEICSSLVNIRGLSLTRSPPGTPGAAIGSIAGRCPATYAGISIAGNFIGLTSGGVAGAGSTADAIEISAAQVLVGGPNAADRNVIGAYQNGVILEDPAASGSQVLGNLIGTDKSGSLDRGNGFAGLLLRDGISNGQVGSLAAPNRIRFGVIGTASQTGGSGNELFANHIDANANLGIDLGPQGVTPNDPNDVDTGPNDLQNFPVIASAERTTGGLSLSGQLDVGHADTRSYRIALYASAACHPSGHGEGERLLGVASVALSSASEVFDLSNFPTTDPLPPGTVITTTAASNTDSTSEFSACFELDPSPLVVTSSDDVDDGNCNAAHCSLREAINAINASTDPRPRPIHFNIASPASGEIRIDLLVPLPTITHTLSIDGYSQPGSAPNTDPDFSNAVIRIRLHGSSRPLTICADDVTVRGLSITSAANTALSVGTNTAGVSCSAGHGSQLVGNYIGLPPSGAAGFANLIGIGVTGVSVQIGGAAPADRNVISSNNIGLRFSSAGIGGSEVLGNLFGTDPTGALDRGNPTGILLNTTVGNNNVLIGVAVPNRFRFNGRAIVASDDDDDHHRWTGNLISDSTVQAIDLGNDGVTLNDLDDVDTGPNGLQNFPVLTGATLLSATTLRVSGMLDVTALTFSGQFRIEIFANTSCAASGHGEGQFLVGSVLRSMTQTTGETFEFDLVTDLDLSLAPHITATASSLEGSSEFSACLEISDTLLADGFE